MKKEKVVYTCITGGYDAIPCHAYVDDDWDYILFTDNQELIKQGHVYHWEVRENLFNKLNKSRNSRYCKVNAHIALVEYKYSFYLDANILINNDALFAKLNKLIEDNVTISIPLHPSRSCIYDEACVIKERVIDFPEIVDKQIAFLQEEQYPYQNGLFENCMIFRKHHSEKLILAQELWWKMIVDFSKRDQLSGLYALWKHGVVVHPLFDSPAYRRHCTDVTFVYLQSHNQGKLSLKQKYPDWLIRVICLLVPFKKTRKQLRIDLKKKGDYYENI